MVTVLSLWLPILLAAILVFIVSSILHMVLTYHRNDMRRLPNEEKVREALQPLSIPPGDYVVPYAGDTATMKSPEYRERLEKGPVAFMTVLPSGQISMGASLAQWFLYAVAVGIAAAYVAGRALGPGAPYLEVFRFTGTAALLGYAFALAQNSIWYRRNWTTTLRSMFDGLIYALLTAGVFGWLWPAG
jgi:hypothetical protein